MRHARYLDPHRALSRGAARNALGLLILAGGLLAAPEALASGLLFRRGDFAKSTAVGSQSITGVGFQPKAVIFYWTKQTATGTAADVAAGYGFTTGAGANRAIAVTVQDAISPANTQRRQSQSFCIVMLDAADATPLRAQASLSTFDTDGFTLNWATNNAPSVSSIIHYVALGGVDLSNALAGSFTPTVGVGTQGVGGVGFRPDFLMFFSIDSAALDTNLTSAEASLGFAAGPNGSISQVGLAAQLMPNGATSGTNGQSRSDNALVEVSPAGGAVQQKLASVQSLDADGFTINKSVGVDATPVHFLALKGGLYKVGAFNKTPTNTPPDVDQAVTGVGFEPIGLILASRNKGAAAGINTEAKIHLGAADPLSQAATSVHNLDCCTTGNERTETSKLATFINGAALEAEADRKTFDPDGFTLRWTTQTNPDAREILYAAFGSSCCALTTSKAGTKITVDTADVKMVWDAAGDGGGGLAELYGKMEANSGVSRSGDTPTYNVFATQVNDDVPAGNTWHFEGNDNAATSFPGADQLLEVTTTRVKVRQLYDYTSAAHLQRDWSIYGFPRLAINETLTFDDGIGRRGATGIHAKGELTCGGANTFYCSGVSDEPNGIWLVTDDSGTYSDMLAVVNTAPLFVRPAAGYTWEVTAPPPEPGTPNTVFARVHESAQDPTGPGIDNRFYLLYPHLAGLTTAGTEWQPYADDYRGPASLGINLGKGSQWQDAAENTAGAGDFFNEAEAAYLVDFNPSLGLDFNIDGSVTNRKTPFFKIRQWRSLLDPPSVTIDGVALTNNADYLADVKPISTAYFCTTAGCGASTQIANGGLVGDAAEYLNDGSAPPKNFTLNLAAVATQYLYLGSDSRFHGLNITLATGGVGTADLQWQYWNGASWANLEAVAGFFDETQNLKRNGTVYWNADPAGWATTTPVSGGPSLYYVRATLGSGSYTTPPVEAVIKTDILLFQYCGNVTANSRFIFSLPTPTAVELLSFEATAGDAAVELRWATGSELNNLGFHLYRSLSPEGPYERVTPAVIPGQGSSPLGASYRYVDSRLTNGVTYWYRLEDIETTGQTKLHGPISASLEAGASGPAPGTGPAPTSPSEPEDPRIAYGEPAQNRLRLTRVGASEVLLELETAGFYAYPQADGSVRIEVPGFGGRPEPGAPAIPTKRAWVEAMAGQGVRLDGLGLSEIVTLGGLRPTAEGSPEMAVSADGTVRPVVKKRPEGSPFRRAGLYPEKVARLVEVAFQGEVKKALVDLSPLRWDGASQQLLLAKRLSVRVVFEGLERKERSLGGSRGRRPPELPGPGGPVLARLVTRGAGLYGVRFEDLFGSVRGIAAAGLRLSRQGAAVAYHLEPETGLYGRGSVLYFVSEGASLNPWDTEAVYELGEGPREAMPVVSAGPSGLSAGYYWKYAEWEQNVNHQAGLLEARDLWLWEGLVSPVTKSYAFLVDQLAAVSEPSLLTVYLEGASDFEADPDHHVRVSVNGAWVGETSWDGKRPGLIEAEIPGGLLREGTNALQIENVGDTGAAYSFVFLDKFAVSYPRRLEAEAGVLRGRFSRSGTAVISGLSKALVVDTTAQPRWVRAGRARVEVEAGRSYLMTEPSAVKRPEVRRPGTSDLRSPANRADYVLVGPREFLAAAQPLLERRRSQGLLATAVAVEDVYEEFGHGEAGPAAVKDFVAYAYHHWQAPSLRYLVLFGDGSYDFKGYVADGKKNRVLPLMLKTTYLWTASDPGYGAVNGEDALPDLAVGRLSASTLAEAQALVEKTLAFEDSGERLTGNVVLAADNADAGGPFEGDSDQVAALLAGRPVERIYLRDHGASSMRGAIKDAFNGGASLLSYVGHGGTAVWASENVFNVGDVDDLLPQARQPFLMTMNCLNGFFIGPTVDSLAETLVKVPGRGAVAAFAPSGLSVDRYAHEYQEELIRELESGRHSRLGDAVLAAQAAYADRGALPELLSVYHLLGDPALRIQ